jgi:hypothetical protein
VKKKIKPPHWGGKLFFKKKYNFNFVKTRDANATYQNGEKYQIITKYTK